MAHEFAAGSRTARSWGSGTAVGRVQQREFPAHPAKVRRTPTRMRGRNPGAKSDGMRRVWRGDGVEASGRVMRGG